MKNLIPCLLGLLAFSCGAQDDGFEEQDLGTIEQEYRAELSPSFQMGANTSTAHLRCNRSSAGQICSIPQFKIIEVFSPSGQFTAAQQTLIDGVTTAIDVTTNFDIHKTTVTTPPFGKVRLSLLNSAVSGSLSSNIEGYSGVQYTSPTNLTENQFKGFGAPNVVGSYQDHGACVVNIDVADILNKGANATEDDRLFKHAVGHAILVCAGLGSRSDAGANSVYSRRSIQLAANLSATTLGERCVLDSYTLNNNTDFSLPNAIGCSSD